MNVLTSPSLFQLTAKDPLGDSSILVGELWFLLFLQIVYSYYLEWNIFSLAIRLSQMVPLRTSCMLCRTNLTL
jgi:hypothetical protein